MKKFSIFSAGPDPIASFLTIVVVCAALLVLCVVLDAVTHKGDGKERKRKMMDDKCPIHYCPCDSKKCGHRRLTHDDIDYLMDNLELPDSGFCSVCAA